MLLHRLYRRRIKWLACLAAGLVVVTQTAIAAQGCMLTGASGLSTAVAQATPCDAMGMDEAPCLACCVVGEEAVGALDQHLVFVPPSDSIGSRQFPMPETHADAAHGAAWDVPRGPPLRILFCSYQT